MTGARNFFRPSLGFSPESGGVGWLDMADGEGDAFAEARTYRRYFCAGLEQLVQLDLATVGAFEVLGISA
jgi:hypothetical protein